MQLIHNRVGECTLFVYLHRVLKKWGCWWRRLPVVERWLRKQGYDTNEDWDVDESDAKEGKIADIDFGQNYCGGVSVSSSVFANIVER